MKSLAARCPRVFGDFPVRRRQEQSDRDDWLGLQCKMRRPELRHGYLQQGLFRVQRAGRVHQL
jgi:hypothetical protein